MEETFEEARPHEDQEPAITEPAEAPGEAEPGAEPGDEPTPDATEPAGSFAPAEEEPSLAESIPDQPVSETVEPPAPIQDDAEPAAAELGESDQPEALADDVVPSAEDVPAEEAAVQVLSEDEAVASGVTLDATDDEGADDRAPAVDVEPSVADADELPAAEPEQPPAPAAAEPEVPAVEAAPAPADEAPTPQEEVAAEPPAWSPMDGPGDWYVVHTYAGYENKVKANLSSRISSMQMEDKIFEVVIPMEDVMEIKGGKKQVVQKKVFPGYLLVKMFYDNDSWYVVRNTPGVTGFVVSGTGQKPTPLSRKEVEKILAVKEEEKAKKPAFRLEFEEGDVVRIISGPFADFNGTIVEINVDQSKLKVLVNIFDRETPVELGFDQVARV